MLARLKENWDGRTSSERLILIVVATCFVCSVFYLSVYDPLVTWREQEQKKLAANTRVLTQLNRLVPRVIQNTTSGPRNAEGLATVIDKSLQKNGLTMQGFQPGQQGDARLRLSNVTYEAAVQWLYDLEYAHNIVVEELSIAQEKTPGLLRISIRVRPS